MCFWSAVWNSELFFFGILFCHAYPQAHKFGKHVRGSDSDDDSVQSLDDITGFDEVQFGDVVDRPPQVCQKFVEKIMKKRNLNLGMT